VKRAVALLSLLLTLLIAGALYLLTLDPSQEDPCLDPQSDISGAILADDEDQDALANRAMLQRKLCEKPPPKTRPD
jgi:hypothetical protein